MKELVRVLRTLEYIGDREIVEKNISLRSIKGTKIINKDLRINEAIIGDLVEVLQLSSNYEIHVNDVVDAYINECTEYGNFVFSRKKLEELLYTLLY